MRRRHPRHPRHDLPCAPPSPRRQAKREAEAAKREADERARREESFRFREEGLQKKLKAAHGGAPPGRELFDKSEGSPRSPDQLTGWEQGGGRAKAGVRKSGGVAAGKGGLPKPGAVEAEVRKLKEENERLTEAKSQADAEIRQLRAERDAKRPTPPASKRGSTNSAAAAAVAKEMGKLEAKLDVKQASTPTIPTTMLSSTQLHTHP